MSDAPGPASVFHCRLRAVSVEDPAMRRPSAGPERDIQPRRAPAPALRARSRSARAPASPTASTTALRPESPRSLLARPSRVRVVLPRSSRPSPWRTPSRASSARRAAGPPHEPSANKPSAPPARSWLPSSSRLASGFAEPLSACRSAAAPAACAGGRGMTTRRRPHNLSCSESLPHCALSHHGFQGPLLHHGASRGRPRTCCRRTMLADIAHLSLLSDWQVPPGGAGGGGTTSAPPPGPFVLGQPVSARRLLPRAEPGPPESESHQRSLALWGNGRAPPGRVEWGGARSAP